MGFLQRSRKNGAKKRRLNTKRKNSAPFSFSDPKVRQFCDAMCEKNIGEMDRLIAEGVDVNSIGIAKKAVRDETKGNDSDRSKNTYYIKRTKVTLLHQAILLGDKKSSNGCCNMVRILIWETYRLSSLPSQAFHL
jgi:hypothetical protein